jgi:hypothetical protein
VWKIKMETKIRHKTPKLKHKCYTKKSVCVFFLC